VLNEVGVVPNSVEKISEVSVMLEEVIDQLAASKAGARRTAAKKLRKLGDLSAEDPLISALERELEHPRTWEAQFEMIAALGTCGGVRAEEVVRGLAERHQPYDSLYTAAGETALLLAVKRGMPGEAVHWSLSLRNADVIDGVLKGIAETDAALSPSDIGDMLDFLESQDPHEGVHYWAAVASSGWAGERVGGYLARLSAGPRADVADAAKKSANARDE
jgi:hypothetical protein